MKRIEFYKSVKIAGMLLYIPLILAAGPLSGYFIGDYLVKKIHFPLFVLLVFIIAGFAAALMETIRIIKLALRVEGKSGRNNP
ncbi:MAG: hypothetical protein HY761_01805 [Candidatus Omnitrophica bacterium]|nr:hypothetical protein [Candidatus Omnitrophota bacterium]